MGLIHYQVNHQRADCRAFMSLSVTARWVLGRGGEGRRLLWQWRMAVAFCIHCPEYAPTEKWEWNEAKILMI